MFIFLDFLVIDINFFNDIILFRSNMMMAEVIELLTKLFVDDTQKSYFLNLASILLLKSL
jgi:hypothetical protein